MKYKGIGQAKAITIAAALELGNRKQSEPKQEIRSIKSSNDSYQILNYHFQGLHQEEFYILLLNKALKPLKVERISIGNTDATLVDIKIIAKCALENLAQAIVLAHNHPSGRLQPSVADENLTKKIKNAMALLDITLVDHLIITDNGYFSFADEGKI
jgi:DNA repair protein RadC